MPNVEWMALGEEPGCRQAAMDPQFKLFGQTISVIASHTGAGADAGVLKPTRASPPWDTAPTSNQDVGDNVLLGIENKGVGEKLVSARSSSRDEFLQLFKTSKLATECGAPNAGAFLCDESEGAQSDELKDQGDGDQSTHSVGDGKSLQKPDKVVACPRCNSQDTKFCYYNNYNVNQPRHFCKNCQRYWTAGGTLRNVPVGAGRRKNKSGGLQQQQRDNCAEASPNCSFQIDSGDSASQLFSCGLRSPTSQKATSLKLSHPKKLAGQGSPLRSPGSTTSFGQDSGITMSSPPYSLCQNGRLPFQSFNSCSQGFTTSGTEVSAVGSSDSASTLRGHRLVRFPPGNGFDKDCTRSSPSGQVQDAANLGAMQTAAFNASLLQRESSGTFKSDTASGWAGNGGPVRFFNGEWPHGYNLEWNGKHPVPASQGASFAPGVAVLTSYNTTCPTPPNPTSSWSPAPAPRVTTPWASNMGHVSNAPTGWTGIAQQPLPLQSTLGKRQGLSDRRADNSPAKTLRTDVESKNNLRSSWPMLQGRNQSAEMHTSSVGTLKQLFHPKLEPASAACEPKGTFMSRLFNNAAAPRPVPFPVTI